MRALILDIQTRLVAALPAGTPVLLPEERETPMAGRKPGGEGGLRTYLGTHTQGYVQIEEALGISASGPTETYWCPVASLASTGQGAEALSRLVLSALCGVPGRDPGYYTLITPDSTHLLSPDVFITRPTISRLIIGTLL